MSRRERRKVEKEKRREAEKDLPRSTSSLALLTPSPPSTIRFFQRRRKALASRSATLLPMDNETATSSEVRGGNETAADQQQQQQQQQEEEVTLVRQSRLATRAEFVNMSPDCELVLLRYASPAVDALRLLTGVKLLRVAVSDTHAVALAGGCELWAWGTGGSGQLGLGEDVCEVERPQRLAYFAERFVDKNVNSLVCSGSTTACIVDERLFVWGKDLRGSSHWLPFEMADLAADGWRPQRILLSSCHAALLAQRDQRSSVLTWGSAAFSTAPGILGLGKSVPNAASPGVVDFADEDIIDIATSARNMAAVTRLGKVYAWGRNAIEPHRDLLCIGLPNQRFVYVPQLVDTAGEVFSSVKCGEGFCLAQSIDGHLYSWGLNRSGCLGTGLVDTAVRPVTRVRLPDAADDRPLQLHGYDTGSCHAVAWSKNTSRLYLWGAVHGLSPLSPSLSSPLSPSLSSPLSLSPSSPLSPSARPTPVMLSRSTSSLISLSGSLSSPALLEPSSELQCRPVVYELPAVDDVPRSHAQRVVYAACSPGGRLLLALAQDYFDVHCQLQPGSAVRMSTTLCPTVQSVLVAAQRHWPALPADAQLLDSQQQPLDLSADTSALLACGVPASFTVGRPPQQEQQPVQASASLATNSSRGIVSSGSKLRDGNGSLLGVISVEELVRVCCGGHKQRRSALLLTYPTFDVSPMRLLQEIVNVFFAAATADSSTLASGGRRKTEARAMSLLSEWSSSYRQDFFEAPDVLNTLFAFLDEAASIRYPFAAKTIKNRFLLGASSSNNNNSSSSASCTLSPDNAATPRALHSGPPDLFKWEPLVVAQQLTLVEWQCLSRVNPRELLGAAWTKPDKHSRAGTVLTYIRRFNQVSEWTAATVLGGQSPAERTEIFKRFLRICDALLALHNYNTLFSIVSGLLSHAVSRLSFALPESCEKRFDKLQSLINPLGNRRAYRTHFDDAPHPKIPFLASLLGDLTFLEELPATITDERGVVYLSFVKRQRVYAAVSSLTGCQHVPYNLLTCPEVAAYLLLVQGFANHEQSAMQLSRAIQANDAQQHESILRTATSIAPAAELPPARHHKPPTPRSILIVLLENQLKSAQTDAAQRLTLWTQWRDRLWTVPMMFGSRSTVSRSNLRSSYGFVGGVSVASLFDNTSAGNKRLSHAASMAGAPRQHHDDDDDNNGDQLVLLQALLSSRCLDMSAQILCSGQRDYADQCLQWMRFALSPIGADVLDPFFDFFACLCGADCQPGLYQTFFHLLSLFQTFALLTSSVLFGDPNSYRDGCQFHQFNLSTPLEQLAAADTAAVAADTLAAALVKLTSAFDWLTAWHNSLAEDSDVLRSLGKLVADTPPAELAAMPRRQPLEGPLRRQLVDYLALLRALRAAIDHVEQPLTERIDALDQQLAGTAAGTGLLEPLDTAALAAAVQSLAAVSSSSHAGELVACFDALQAAYADSLYPRMTAFLAKASQLHSDLLAFIGWLARTCRQCVVAAASLARTGVPLLPEHRDVCRLILRTMSSLPDLGLDESPSSFLLLSVDYEIACSQASSLRLSSSSPLSSSS